MIEPSVSVPTPKGARSNATATAVPLLDPLGVSREVVGVEDLAAQGGIARGHALGEEVGQLREVRLGEDHGSCVPQVSDQSGVGRGDRAGEGEGPDRGRLARHVDVVLDDDGHSFEGAARPVPAPVLVAGFRLLDGVGGHGADRPEERVEALDAREVRQDQLTAARGAVRHRLAQCGDGVHAHREHLIGGSLLIGS